MLHRYPAGTGREVTDCRAVGGPGDGRAGSRDCRCLVDKASRPARVGSGIGGFLTIQIEQLTGDSFLNACDGSIEWMLDMRKLNRTDCRTNHKQRHGYKLIDLIVTVAIIALLLSLLLPAMRQARTPGRRTECLNNLKNLGLAMHNYATVNAGQLPGHGTWSEDGDPRHSWLVPLLPYLDQTALADRWDHKARWDSDTPGVESDTSNLELSQTGMRVLKCPRRTNENAVLNYVVNAGFANHRNGKPHDFDQLGIDWNSDGTVNEADHEIARDCGVLWRTVGERSSAWGLDDFYDGAGNTILLSERLQPGKQNWADPRPDNCAFVFAIDPSSKSVGSARPDPLENVTINGYRSNSNKPAMLSSNHDEQVNIVTAEGAARGLSQDIDPQVLQQLITPRGTLYDEPPLQNEF